MDFTKNTEGVQEVDEFEKEIAVAIKKQLKNWKDATDENVRDFCGIFFRVEELVGNKGFTIEEAINHAVNFG